MSDDDRATAAEARVEAMREAIEKLANKWQQVADNGMSNYRGTRLKFVRDLRALKALLGEEPEP